jgi:hypothetical protein
MKWKILHLGVRSFLGFNEEGENYLEWLELKNKCDKTVFWQDLHNFLNSNYMCDFSLLFDRRVIDYGFNSRLDSEDRFFTCTKYHSMARCLWLIKKNSGKYICLTIGKSVWLPNFGANPSEKVDDFPYPALKGLRNVHIAEIHASGDRYVEKGGDEFINIHNYYRISVYKIDGVTQSIKRLARFENGKVIDESKLKPGEDLNKVLNFSNFNGPGEFRDALAAEGIGFGLACCRGVSETMKKYNVSFADAMSGSIDSGSLIIVQPGDKHKALKKY